MFHISHIFSWLYDISYFIIIQYFTYHILYINLCIQSPIINIHIHIFLSIYLSIYLSMHTYIHLFIYSSISLGVDPRLPQEPPKERYTPPKSNGWKPTIGGVGRCFSFICVYIYLYICISIYIYPRKWCQRYEAGDTFFASVWFFRIELLNFRGGSHIPSWVAPRSPRFSSGVLLWQVGANV